MTKNQKDLCKEYLEQVISEAWQNFTVIGEDGNELDYDENKERYEEEFNNLSLNIIWDRETTPQDFMNSIVVFSSEIKEYLLKNGEEVDGEDLYEDIPDVDFNFLFRSND